MSVLIFNFINNLLHSDVTNVIFQFYNKATCPQEQTCFNLVLNALQ